MKKFTWIAATILFAALVLANGCTSPETYAKQRRDKMLIIYPPGATTRADVLLKWNLSRPEIVEYRPSGGWDKCRDRLIGYSCAASEARTKKRVARCERYISPEGLNSFAYSWFFYDSADRLLDVDWQYK